MSKGVLQMNYIINFSWKGFLIFALAMLPNIYYFTVIKKENKVVKSTHKLLDILEHASQMIFVLLLLFVVNKKTVSIISFYIILLIILLLAYYILWVFYGKNIKNIFVLGGLAILPVLYFIVAELWLSQYLAILPTIFFGVIHCIVTYKDESNI
jgi:hypothetical protein